MRAATTAPNAAVIPSSCRPKIGDNGYEACDDGNQEKLTPCRTDCTRHRGRGVRRTDREAGRLAMRPYDDGNAVQTDACRQQLPFRRCGDEQTKLAWKPAMTGHQRNRHVPQQLWLASCGDGVRRDDLPAIILAMKPVTTGTSRSATVATAVSPRELWEQQVDEGEQCDDGNAIEGDVATLAASELCGNGQVDPGEACDDGNESNTSACRSNCVAARCGDNIHWDVPRAGRRGLRDV